MTFEKARAFMTMEGKCAAIITTNLDLLDDSKGRMQCSLPPSAFRDAPWRWTIAIKEPLLPR
jgi:hypothetical protein